MSIPLPDMPNHCWPISHAACPDPASPDDDVLAIAEQMAVTILRTLTAHQVGGCPVTVRPNQRVACNYPARRTVTDNTLWPTLTCGCGQTINHILLPGPVGRVVEVRVDGLVLDSTKYRVAGETLIRTDGQAWPVYEDGAKPVAGFSVTYVRGHAVDGLGAIAAGVLACEIAKAMKNKPCSLPTGVTSIVRTGITVEVPREAFADGSTGIPTVDSFINYWNPNRLRTPAQVISVDV